MEGAGGHASCRYTGFSFRAARERKGNYRNGVDLQEVRQAGAGGVGAMPELRREAGGTQQRSAPASAGAGGQAGVNQHGLVLQPDIFVFHPGDRLDHMHRYRVVVG